MRSASLATVTAGLLLVAAAAAQTEGAGRDAVSALPEFDGDLQGLYSG